MLETLSSTWCTSTTAPSWSCRRTCSEVSRSPTYSWTTPRLRRCLLMRFVVWKTLSRVSTSLTMNWVKFLSRLWELWDCWAVWTSPTTEYSSSPTTPSSPSDSRLSSSLITISHSRKELLMGWSSRWRTLIWKDVIWKMFPGRCHHWQVSPSLILLRTVSETWDQEHCQDSHLSLLSTWRGMWSRSWSRTLSTVSMIVWAVSVCSTTSWRVIQHKPSHHWQSWGWVDTQWWWVACVATCYQMIK